MGRCGGCAETLSAQAEQSVRMGSDQGGDAGTAAVAFSTKLGEMLWARAEDSLRSRHLAAVVGTVQLAFTSPPFPLNHKKRYGNLQGRDYIDWLASFARPLRELLAPDG